MFVPTNTTMTRSKKISHTVRISIERLRREGATTISFERLCDTDHSDRAAELHTSRTKSSCDAYQADRVTLARRRTNTMSCAFGERSGDTASHRSQSRLHVQGGKRNRYVPNPSAYSDQSLWRQIPTFGDLAFLGIHVPVSTAKLIAVMCLCSTMMIYSSTRIRSHAHTLHRRLNNFWDDAEKCKAMTDFLEKSVFVNDWSKTDLTTIFATQLTPENIAKMEEMRDQMHTYWKEAMKMVGILRSAFTGRFNDERTGLTTDQNVCLDYEKIYEDYYMEHFLDDANWLKKAESTWLEWAAIFPQEQTTGPNVAPPFEEEFAELHKEHTRLTQEKEDKETMSEKKSQIEKYLQSQDIRLPETEVEALNFVMDVCEALPDATKKAKAEAKDLKNLGILYVKMLIRNWRNKPDLQKISKEIEKIKEFQSKLVDHGKMDEGSEEYNKITIYYEKAKKWVNAAMRIKLFMDTTLKVYPPRVMELLINAFGLLFSHSSPGDLWVGFHEVRYYASVLLLGVLGMRGTAKKQNNDVFKAMEHRTDGSTVASIQWVRQITHVPTNWGFKLVPHAVTGVSVNIGKIVDKAEGLQRKQCEPLDVEIPSRYAIFYGKIDEYTSTNALPVVTSLVLEQLNYHRDGETKEFIFDEYMISLAKILRDAIEKERNAYLNDGKFDDKGWADFGKLAIELDVLLGKIAAHNTEAGTPDEADITRPKLDLKKLHENITRVQQDQEVAEKQLQDFVLFAMFRESNTLDIYNYIKDRVNDDDEPKYKQFQSLKQHLDDIMKKAMVEYYFWGKEIPSDTIQKKAKEIRKINQDYFSNTQMSEDEQLDFCENVLTEAIRKQQKPQRTVGGRRERADAFGNAPDHTAICGCSPATKPIDSESEYESNESQPRDDARR